MVGASPIRGVAEWSSQGAHEAHNLEVAGSNPASATNSGACAFTKIPNTTFSDHKCQDCGKPIKLRLVQNKTGPVRYCYRCWRKVKGLPPRVKRKKKEQQEP